jgi:hypothetical protein
VRRQFARAGHEEGFGDPAGLLLGPADAGNPGGDDGRLAAREQNRRVYNTVQ